MNSIINMIASVTGINALLKKMDGYKTKIGGGGLMLAGIGMMATGAAGLVTEALACHDVACGLGLAKAIASDASAGLMLKGFLAFKGGLVAIGLKHSDEKLAEAIKSQAGADQQPPQP